MNVLDFFFTNLVRACGRTYVEELTLLIMKDNSNKYLVLEKS